MIFSTDQVSRQKRNEFSNEPGRQKKTILQQAKPPPPPLFFLTKKKREKTILQVSLGRQNKEEVLKLEEKTIIMFWT